MKQPHFSYNFSSENFVKRLKWSPDGQRLLCNLESGNLQLFTQSNTELTLTEDSIFKGHLGGFNDFEWYPWMSSSVPGSDLFVTVSKDLPIQLWKCDRAGLICTWTAKDHLDQVATALSVTFSPDGQKIISGGMNKLWIFDVNRPGGKAEVEASTIPKRRSHVGQRGLLSCINFRYDNTGVFLVGSFNGSIGIYDLRTVSCNSDEYAQASQLFQAHPPCGVSQVKFLSDGWSFISAGRGGESCLKRWDLRNLSQPSDQFSLPESIGTNQRIYFDSKSDGSSIFTGSSKNLKIIAKDTSIDKYAEIDDLSLNNVISSVSLNPKDPDLLAVSTGTRHFQLDTTDSDTEAESNKLLYQNQIFLINR